MHRGLQDYSSFCTEEFITAAHSPPPPLSLSEEIISLRSNNSEHFPHFNSFSFLVSVPLRFSHHTEAKIGPAAFSLALLSLLRETLGTQRIVLQLSFPEYFSFFFFFSPAWNQEGYFIPLCSMTLKGEESKMAAQIQAAVTPADQ